MSRLPPNAGDAFLNRADIDRILHRSKNPAYIKIDSFGEATRYARILFAVCSYLFDENEMLREQLAARAAPVAPGENGNMDREAR